MSRLKQLFRYMSKVFHVPQLVKGVSDSRDKARVQIATSAVLLAWLIGFSARIGSREKLGEFLDNRAVHKLTGRHISSDTLGRVLGQIDTDSLRTAVLIPLVRQIRRNKAWPNGSIGKQLLIGIDGSEAFCTFSQPCAQCSARQLEVKSNGQPSEITQYYHQAVCAFTVGIQPRIYLDIEPVKPGEGEVTAAIRLVTRLAKSFGRWIDGVVVDAKFAGAPFLNHVRSCDLHYIVRVKDEERRYLTREATERFAKRTADAHWTEAYGHEHYQVSAWDEEAFTQWEGLKEPARVVVCDELVLAKPPHRRRKIAEPERQCPRSFFATSYAQKVFPTHEVWLTYHHRWDIENSGFHQLKHEWHWDHPFVHAPVALENLWLLMVVAANLFVAFVCCRLKSTRTGATPMCRIAEQIAACLLLLTGASVPNWNSS